MLFCMVAMLTICLTNFLSQVDLHSKGGTPCGGISESPAK